MAKTTSGKRKVQVEKKFCGRDDAQAGAKRSSQTSRGVRRREVDSEIGKAKVEIDRLQKVIGKLTATPKGEKPKPRYLDEIALAARWNMSVKHIQNIRYRGDGPPVTYFGRNVRYRLREIQAYERNHTFTSRTEMEVRVKGRI